MLSTKDSPATSFGAVSAPTEVGESPKTVNRTRQVATRNHSMKIGNCGQFMKFFTNRPLLEKIRFVSGGNDSSCGSNFSTDKVSVTTE